MPSHTNRFGAVNTLDNQLAAGKLSGNGFIRKNSLINLGIVPFSTATLWRLVNSGKFPKPVRITEQITAWRIADVLEWVANPTTYVAHQNEVVR